MSLRCPEVVFYDMKNLPGKYTLHRQGFTVDAHAGTFIFCAGGKK
jgi:hypothetical protein